MEITSKQFLEFVKKLAAVNEFSELNIKLIQEFVSSSHSETQRPNILLVVKESRKN